MRIFYIIASLSIVLLLGACGSSGDGDPSSSNQTGGDETTNPKPITEEDLLGEMNLYYGNLHAHTKYSWAEVRDYTPEEIFALARNLGMDFCAVTDHDTWLMTYVGSLNAWSQIGLDADNATVDGEFVALRGFELSNPTYGHICTFNTSDFTDFITTPFDPVFQNLTPSFYSWLDKKKAIAQFNHPGREKRMFNNFEYDETVADNICLIETGNKDDGNYTNDFIPEYILALDNGWRLSPASNQDNHVLSMNSHRTVIVSPELNRYSLFEAIQSRRTYSSDDPDMMVIFKTGEDWMGSSVNTDDDSAVLTIMVKDNEPITKIEIITRGGKTAAKKELNNAETAVLWQVAMPFKSGDYFFVKISESDINNDEFDSRIDKETDRTNKTQVAVTSPIWFYKN